MLYQVIILSLDMFWFVEVNFGKEIPDEILFWLG
jgi:hypothetical protein